MYKNILLIDDSAVDNFFNSTFIKSCELCETLHTFQSAKTALAFLKSAEKNIQETPNLIFLDIEMPDMNGFGFLEEFAKLPFSITQAYKIIILSSRINPNDLQGNENPFVFKFIAKPLTANFLFSIKELRHIDTYSTLPF